MDQERSQSSPASWELSKENIQPLKCGRRLEAVPAELLADNHCSIAALQQAKLSRIGQPPLSPGDPLETWYQRIRTAEQIIVTGKTDQMKALVDECVESLEGRQEYRNDKRMLYIWQKLASVNVEMGSLLVYEYMASHGICTQLADFYIEWASELETADDLKQANEVLLRGIRENAQPVEKMKQAHVEFLSRAGSASHKQNGEEDDDCDAQTRKFSTELRGYGRRMTVPFTRIPADTVPSQLRFGTKNSSSNSGGLPSFRVFAVNSPSIGSVSVRRRNGSEMTPLRDSIVKENMRTPLIWPASKLARDITRSSRSGGLGANTPKFDVYEDDAKNGSGEKVGELSSIKKASKFKVYKHAGMSFLCQPVAFAAGADEMCFEERRAKFAKYAPSATAAVAASALPSSTTQSTNGE